MENNYSHFERKNIEKLNYSKNDWKQGENLTSEDFNHLENGINDTSSKIDTLVDEVNIENEAVNKLVKTSIHDYNDFQRLKGNYENIDTAFSNRVNDFIEHYNNGYYMDFEGQYITINNSRVGLIKDFSMKGETYQNLINTNSEIFVAGNGYENIIDSNNKKEVKALSDGAIVLYKDGMFKDNTTYTVVVNVFISRNIKIGFSFKSGDNYVQGFKDLSPIKVGDYATYIVPITTTTNCTSVVIGNHGAFLTNDIFGVEKLMVFEGDYTNNPNLPSYFEGIVGVGDKSKNLFNGDLVRGWYDVNGNIFSDTQTVRSNNVIPVKPNTGYTISCSTPEEIWVHFYKDRNTISTVNKEYGSGTDSYKTSFAFTTPSDCKFISFNTVTDKYVSLDTKFQLEEGSVATPYEPYYEGHKIEVLSHNQNLINYKDFNLKLLNTLPPQNKLNIFRDGYIEVRTNDSSYNCELAKVYVKQNTDYYFSAQNDNTNCQSIANAKPSLYVYDGNLCELKMAYGVNEITFNSKNNTFIYLGIITHSLNQLPDNEFMKIYDVMLSEGNSYKEYIPYKENKIQILLDEPLMKLPNSVCDEITKDGKLIRRVGKVVLDGSEYWNSIGFGGHSTRNSFETKLSTNYNGPDINISGISNNFSLSMESGIPSADWSFRIVRASAISYGNFDYLLFTPSTDIVPYRDIQSWKQWLSQNPTTVYYELKTPIEYEFDSEIMKDLTFKDMTYITTNCKIKPNLKLKAPVDTQAIVSNLKANNMALMKANNDLEQQNINYSNRVEELEKQNNNADAYILDTDMKVLELEMKQNEEE